MVKNYSHKVQYYETDKMGVTHHSNYLRFMEEARVDFLEQIGYGYDRMEKEGLVSPVISVNVNYVRPTTFGDELQIAVKVKNVTAVKLTIDYTMTCNGDVVCAATSTHCFVDKNARPISLKRVNPQLFELLSSLAEANDI